MLNKVVAFAASVLCLLAPLAAAADAAIPLGPSPEQLLAREAFLKAESDGVPVACAVKASKASVAVNEAFALWWGSYGSAGGGWSPTGSYTIVASAKGVYGYKFSFVNGTSSATCHSTVSVL